MQSKNLTNILLAILIIILGAITYFLASPNLRPHSENGNNATSTAEVKRENPTITSKKIEEKNSQAHYEISMEYPQLKGLSNNAIEAKINAAIEKYAKSIVSDFKTSEGDVSVEVGPAQGGASTLDASYKTILPGTISNIITIKFSEEFYSAGAAHPGHMVSTLHYDLKTGNLLQLSDLFSGDYIKVMSAYSIKAVKAKLGADGSVENIESGAGPSAENFEVFTIGDSGLTITFNEYQVAGYAAGPQEITIPYTSLKSVINVSGPLKSFK